MRLIWAVHFARADGDVLLHRFLQLQLFVFQLRPESGRGCASVRRPWAGCRRWRGTAPCAGAVRNRKSDIVDHRGDAVAVGVVRTRHGSPPAVRSWAWRGSAVAVFCVGLDAAAGACRRRAAQPMVAGWRRRRRSRWAPVRRRGNAAGQRAAVAPCDAPTRARREQARYEQCAWFKSVFAAGSITGVGLRTRSRNSGCPLTRCAE